MRVSMKGQDTEEVSSLEMRLGRKLNQAEE